MPKYFYVGKPEKSLAKISKITDNLLMNYRRYQNVIADQRTVDSLNAKDSNTLQEFSKNHSIVIPTRYNGRQTSIKIRTCIAALHVYIVGGEDVKSPKQFLMDAVRRIAQRWYGEDGKGLSGFVTDALVRECFDNEEKGHFDLLVGKLNIECESVGSTRVHNGYNSSTGESNGSAEEI